MYWSVRKVEPRDDYSLVLTFEDGKRRVFDMKPFLDRGIFKDLLDIGMFKTAHVSFDSVAWANDADFDPEALYEGGLPLAD